MQIETIPQFPTATLEILRIHVNRLMRTQFFVLSHVTSRTVKRVVRTMPSESLMPTTWSSPLRHTVFARGLM